MKTRAALEVLTPEHWKDYELIDSGGGLKLERFGPYSFIRPEPLAMWSPAMGEHVWGSAHGKFQSGGEDEAGGWDFQKKVNSPWKMTYQDLSFWAEPSPFRHLRFFPEQAPQWEWVQAVIKNSRRPVKLLNLFGYTGIATLAAAQAGASVTHIDASKKVVTWARENQTLSGLRDKPIRWIVDDVSKFVQREIRRGARYDAIILDPPKFGRGPKNEVWKIEDDLPKLIQICRQLLSEKPLFIWLTTYASRMSALGLQSLLTDAMRNLRAGEVRAGEMAIEEQSAGRILPCAMFARWQSGDN